MKDTVKNYPSLRVENLDGLYLGTTVLESAGYNSLSLSKPISPTLQTALDKKQLKPGLLNYMSVCLPFKRIYTHGDCGITQIARDTVNKDNGPVLQPMPEDVPGNIEHMPDNRQLMEKETAPGYNNYFPKQLLIASVDREFDTVSLDLLLADCEIRDDGFQAYLFAGETLPQGLIRRHHINILPVTWADYLDSPEFRVYYNQQLKRLFKEFHHWPRIDGFTGRKKESLTLHKALQRFSRLQVCGAVGVGKTALLAKLADELQHDRKIIWIHADSPFISKSEVLLSTAMQMDLISSPDILEKENLKNFFSLLEGEIETHLNAGEFLVIFDSLDPFLNQGRHLLENKELQELLTRWATGTGTTGRMKLVFTADIRIKDSENEPFKNLKSQLGRAVSNEEQKIFLKPMDDDNRLELFRLWLRPFADKQKFRQVVNRLYKIGGNNLRMLRLLAIWVRKVRDVKVIEEKSSALEECRVWEKEDLIYGYIFGAISQRKQVILKTLEWIGRPVQREVICSAAGMTEALEQLLEERLVIRDGKNDTYELVYRFGRTRERGTSEFSKKAAENAVVSAIHTLRRLGDIAGRDSARAVDYYYGGNKMCERTGKWWKWKGAPVINLSGFLSWAQVLVKQSKKPKVSPGDKREMALRAIHLCQKSIEAGIETDNSLFVYAQAMSIAYPNSHEDEIRQLYEKSIAIRQRVDKHGRFAIFLNNRLKDYEAAELQFKKARELEAENKRFNISGLYSQAELYLHCQGHEKKAGDILNRVIRKKENRYHNSFLAARLFQVQELRFMTVFFFETCNEIEPQGIRALNSYANACVQWQDKDKAKLLFEEALKIAPKHIPTYNSFANACVLWQDKDKAKQLFEEALKIAAIHVPSLNSSANDYVHWQDNDETKQLFEALKRNSQKVFRDIRESFIWKILDSYSNACVQWKEQDKAIHLLDTSLKIDPQSVLRVVIEFCAWEILDSYANACVQWQDKDKAKLFFEESIKIDPKNVPTLNSYANACTQWGDKDKAIALFNKALSLEPGNIQVLDAYGKARARWGEKEESKKLLEKAKAIKATQPSTTTSGEGQEKEQMEELLRETAATPPPFTFTPEEKEWLTSTQNRERTWTGSPKWAAFGILYTLYYMRSQLESTAQLGDHSSRAKEHKRQYATLRDLAEILRKGETTPGEPTGKPSIQWEDQWFQKEGPPFQLMSYYDSQMHTHPRNPVSAAFLAQAIEAHGWGNIADVIKKEALEKWVGNDTKKWLPFMAHKSVNLLTVKGRERFLAFLQDRYPRQDATGAQPLDENSISRFIGRFSSNWEEMPHYFPQEQLTPEEENRTLNKLTGILENLETILKDITLHKNNAFGALGQSIEELAVPEAIMQRLDAYVDGLEKHAPTPSLPED